VAPLKTPFRVVTLVAALVLSLGLAVAPASASSPTAKRQQSQECPATLEQPRKIVTTSNNGSSHRIILTNLVHDADLSGAAYPGTIVGYNFDETPAWTDTSDPDRRYYWYEASAEMDRTQSIPCTDPDIYEARAFITCWRHGPAGNAESPCYFQDEELSLHRCLTNNSACVSVGGYHKYARGNTADCVLAANTPHAIPDDRAAKAKVFWRVHFRNPFNTSEIIHTAVNRSMTSHGIWQGSFAFSGQELMGPVSMPAPSAGPDLC